MTVATNPSSIGSVSGGGSYNSGSSASFSVSQSTVQVSSNTRYVFDHWSGDYSGTGTSGTVTVNNPMTVTAVYQLQYYLNVQTDQGAASGSGWYNAGSAAQISVSTPISTQYGVSIVFDSWQGDTQSSSQTTTVLMNGPKNVVATWQADYSVLYLTAGVGIAIVLIAVFGALLLMRGNSSRGRATSVSQPMAASAAGFCSNCGKPFQSAHDGYCASCGTPRTSI